VKNSVIVTDQNNAIRSHRGDMTTSIQGWINLQLRGKSSDEPSAPVRQALFVRDTIVPLFCHDLIETDFDRIRELGKVIGTHMCYSQSYGVFDLDRPEIGLRLTMRGATDWKLSVVSEIPITAKLGTLTWTKRPNDGSHPLSNTMFEGFPRELVFGYMADDQRRFSLSLASQFHLWAAIHMIMINRGLLKDSG
jgi:hypothetical protein